jgi:two-component system sensor histidine kinase DesK
LADVRHAIRGYRAKGLPEELAQARATLETAGVHSECNISEAQLAAGRLSAAQETVIALAIRESVTNVVRHARARSCRLEFERGVGFYKVIVADDGCGSSQPEGNGLRGMRERIEALGGTLERETGRGTRLVITIPVHLKQGTIA